MHRLRRLSALGALTATTAAVSLLGAGAAVAEDNQPPDPTAGWCALFPGGPKTVPPGVPVQNPVGTSPPGVYACVNGQWFLVAALPYSYFEGGPALVVDQAATTVAEGRPARVTGYAAAADGTPAEVTASVGTVTVAADGNWTWTHTPDDGPAETQAVVLMASAAGRLSTASFDLTVTDVAPTAALSPAGVTAISGQPVTLSGSASDPSAADTAAGFGWAFDGTASSSPSYSFTPSGCGTRSVSLVATDKDGLASSPATAAVTTVEARFAAPLTAGAVNAVRAGQVLPVRLFVGCGSTATPGLAPVVDVLAGDLDPTAGSGDPSVVVPVSDASGSDTSRVMRESGGAYLYALRVPSAAAGTLLTARVRPFAGSTAAAYALLTIRS